MESSTTPNYGEKRIQRNTRIKSAIHDVYFFFARGKNAFGYEPSELEGKSILSILHPADHSAFVQTAGALLAMAVGVAGVDAPRDTINFQIKVPRTRIS